MHVPRTSVNVFLCALTMKGFQIHQTAQKVAWSSSLWLPQPNHDPSPQAHWPGSYVHSGQPFPDSIKEAAELKETEGENGGAESLTTSTMTTTVSKSCPAFWRGRPLKIWEPHSQQHTEPSQLRENPGLWQNQRQRQRTSINSWPCSQTTKEETARGTLWFSN